MKLKQFFSAITLIFIFVVATNLHVIARDYYQLKVYTIQGKTQEAVIDKYLKDAYIPAMHKLGVKHIGVFKPIADNATAGTKIVVFIPLKTIGQIEEIEGKLAKDKDYQTAGSEYINASWETPPYVRMESILLKAFAEMPKYGVPNHKTPASERIYELRSYEGPTEKMYRKKVEMFNEGGEVKIFHSLDFQEIFYGEVLSGSAMPNLMYLTTFASMKTHDEKWDAFRSHPDWKTLSAKEEYKHTVSHSDKFLMHPTDYSDL